ncbi:DUF3108 domain-containing protein [Opitutales bacterium]|nr:DUF3108 domain-containing protein [Opitutales bacterium]
MRKFFCYLFILVSFCTEHPQAEGIEPLPFKVGERLEYDLAWGFLPVGKATLHLHSVTEINDITCFLIKFSVRTNSFADSFYKVRTTIESYVTEDFSKSILYRKDQQEGKTKRIVEVDFNYQKRRATYRRSDGVQTSIAIPKSVLDPLALAYFFRLKNLKENKKWTIPTCDGKRFNNILVRSGQKKEISVPAGKFDAIETFPEMENLRGVFNKSPDGLLKVWYSGDRRQLPVKISSKVIVGSFNAELKNIAK